jgi:hypothetical protein
MEYRDILTGKMTPVDPEKRQENEDLQKQIEELKAIVAQLVEDKGV